MKCVLINYSNTELQNYIDNNTKNIIIIKVFTYPRAKIAFSLSPNRQEAITPTNPVIPKYT